MRQKFRTAIEKINKRGVLLVYPIKNQKEPASIWSEFYPRKKMNWEWDESGDNSVHDMWYLMKKLSASSEVVYSKWYQNRATFFSREVFTAVLSLKMKQENFGMALSRHARDILDVLEDSSPMSTREVKKLTDLQGRANEGFYNRAMRELFQQYLIVGYGEVDDGAFPSLAVGATKNLFEDLWMNATKMRTLNAQTIVEEYLPKDSKVRKLFDKLQTVNIE